jgi:hypothetical protein
MADVFHPPHQASAPWTANAKVSSPEVAKDGAKAREAAPSNNSASHTISKVDFEEVEISGGVKVGATKEKHCLLREGEN